MRLSISRIKAFKSCRRMYQLKYIERLEPVKTPDALSTGKTYHKFLESLNNGDESVLDTDYSKENAMAIAYHKYIYPHFKVKVAEKWLEYDLGDGDKLVGIADGIADDGHIVEHKSYGGTDSMEQYEYNLLWDEQILAYMLMTGMRRVWYTVCRKPNIRLKKGETEEEFFGRMVAWYDEDTENKIRLFDIERTDAEVEEFRQNLLCICAEMKGAQDMYRNTCHCNMYGRRCEYSSICLHYDPNQEYIEFVKGEEYEPENN